MDKKYEEELAPAMRDVVQTKKWIVGKGFHYLFDEFKESDILNASITVLVSGTIADGIRLIISLRIVTLVSAMDKKYEEELAPAMRDVVQTKKWIVGKGFHYLFDEFKESDILNASITALVSGTIADGI
nr:hypothetical protein [Tanacetum cinerariifolium]